MNWRTWGTQAHNLPVFCCIAMYYVCTAGVWFVFGFIVFVSDLVSDPLVAPPRCLYIRCRCLLCCGCWSVSLHYFVFVWVAPLIQPSRAAVSRPAVFPVCCCCYCVCCCLMPSILCCTVSRFFAGRTLTMGKLLLLLTVLQLYIYVIPRVFHIDVVHVRRRRVLTGSSRCTVQ